MPGRAHNPASTRCDSWACNLATNLNGRGPVSYAGWELVRFQPLRSLVRPRIARVPTSRALAEARTGPRRDEAPRSGRRHAYLGAAPQQGVAQSRRARAWGARGRRGRSGHPDSSECWSMADRSLRVRDPAGSIPVTPIRTTTQLATRAALQAVLARGGTGVVHVPPYSNWQREPPQKRSSGRSNRLGGTSRG